MLSIPDWLRTIPDVVKLPITGLVGFLVGIAGDQVKNALPRRHDRARLYSILGNAFSLVMITFVSLRYTVTNQRSELGVHGSLSRQWRQLMRCRTFLKQKRYGEFLKWENFKTLSASELVAAKEIAERLSQQEEAVTGDFDKDIDFLKRTCDVFLVQLRMNRLDPRRFKKALSREKTAVLTEIFAAGRDEALQILEEQGDAQAKAEVEQLIREVGLHLNKAEILSDLIKVRRG